jgi:hypothetical protein
MFRKLGVVLLLIIVISSFSMSNINASQQKDHLTPVGYEENLSIGDTLSWDIDDQNIHRYNENKAWYQKHFNITENEAGINLIAIKAGGLTDHYEFGDYSVYVRISIHDIIWDDINIHVGDTTTFNILKENNTRLFVNTLKDSGLFDLKITEYDEYTDTLAFTAIKTGDVDIIGRDIFQDDDLVHGYHIHIN